MSLAEKPSSINSTRRSLSRSPTLNDIETGRHPCKEKKTRQYTKGKLKGNPPDPTMADFQALGKQESLQPCQADGMAQSLPASYARLEQKTI
jgi:hypothetical protein